MNNTIIERCKVTCTIADSFREIQINYYGENILDETSDSINFLAMFAKMKQKITFDYTLTFVCSWGDFCDRKYIQNWSQWFYNISFIDMQNEIAQYFKDIIQKEYLTEICYVNDQATECSGNICFGLINKKGIINKCAEMSEIPPPVRMIANATVLMPILESIFVAIETKISKIFPLLIYLISVHSNFAMINL